MKSTHFQPVLTHSGPSNLGPTFLKATSTCTLLAYTRAVLESRLELGRGV